MNKIGSILCVIDFSDASKEALSAAVDVANNMKSRLSVLYPYRLNQLRNVQWKKTIDEDATAHFKSITNDLFKAHDVTWEFKPEIGFINDRVEAYTQKNDVSMIIMSAELFLASNEVFAGVVNKLTCPLMIVPNSSISSRQDPI